MIDCDTPVDSTSHYYPSPVPNSFRWRLARTRAHSSHRPRPKCSCHANSSTKGQKQSQWNATLKACSALDGTSWEVFVQVTLPALSILHGQITALRCVRSAQRNVKAVAALLNKRPTVRSAGCNHTVNQKSDKLISYDWSSMIETGGPT